MTTNQRLFSALGLIALLLLSASAQAQPGGARPGWTLAAGTLLTHLELDDSDVDYFSNTDTGFYEYGAGGFLQVGYAFGRSFELHLRLAATEHSTAKSLETFSFHRVQLEAVVPVQTSGRVQPYLAGGLGGGGIMFKRDDQNSDALVGANVELGGGVEVFPSRRWSLAIDYRLGVQSYNAEHVKIDGELTETDVDLSSRSHTFQARATFSF